MEKPKPLAVLPRTVGQPLGEALPRGNISDILSLDDLARQRKFNRGNLAIAGFG